MLLLSLIIPLAAWRTVAAFEVNTDPDYETRIAAVIGTATGLIYESYTEIGLDDPDVPYVLLSQGTFIDGPQGFGNGMIVTTGKAADAVPGSQEPSFDGERRGSRGYCFGPSEGTRSGPSLDPNLRQLYLAVEDEGIKEITGRFIFATEEPIGGADDIMQIYYGFSQEKVTITDENGQVVPQPISAQSEWFLANAITPPESGSRYARSTRILTFTIDISASEYVQSIIFSVCEVDNGLRDSAIMFTFGTASADDGSGETDLTDDSIDSTVEAVDDDDDDDDDVDDIGEQDATDDTDKPRQGLLPWLLGQLFGQ